MRLGRICRVWNRVRWRWWSWRTSTVRKSSTRRSRLRQSQRWSQLPWSSCCHQPLPEHARSWQLCWLQERLRHEEVLLWNRQREDKTGYDKREIYIYLIPMFVAVKRSWNMFYLPLRDLVLYCFKEEKTAQSQSSFESTNTAVRTNHSVA